MLVVNGAYTFHSILLSFDIHIEPTAKTPRQRLGYSVRGVFVFKHIKEVRSWQLKQKRQSQRKRKG